ncbi:AMP-binding protein [Vibrio viridaestus]|uniref:AMP-dependent synthetase n=1 Tax=Vibrio viridaestus TaxID=2487322 RepID=A0A3N9TGB5_9VIBR|nr:AMP-binding protein [Vibrio viridaestus]RQW63030.1 AMP-dependent synthetase [Vibrio viridaestus]
MAQRSPSISSRLLYPDEHLLRWAKDRPNDIYLKQIIDRQFRDYTFAQVAEKASAFSHALVKLGAKPDDRIAIISKNCAEWFIYDFACMMGNFISVPIFPTANQETITHCLKHSEAKILIVGKLDSPDEIEKSLHELDSLTTISLPYDSSIKCDHEFEFLLRYSQPDFECLSGHNESDIMSIVYTSGTSGTPKGAMLTYSGFSWSVNQLSNLIGVSSEDRMFSYLPLSHITERVFIMGISIETGLSVAFPESLYTFIDDVKMHRPTLFISVPRLWTLFKERIDEKLSPRKLNFLLKIPILRRLIRHKIAEGLGLDKARVLGCGSAPISPALLKWYQRIGLRITEAWGMTENYAFGTLNYPYNKKKLGSIGIPGPGINIHIADDGEILVESKGLFSGYYKQPLETRKAFTPEKWLKTGDVGSIDSQGYVYIKGRKGDTFKTAKGKYVSPHKIEKLIVDRVKVNSICLIGPGVPAPVLLIVPFKFENLNRSRYEKTIYSTVTQINTRLQSHEQIRGVLIVKEPWSVENGILTPTLKVKRHLLEQKYAEMANQWPSDELIHWE